MWFSTWSNIAGIEKDWGRVRVGIGVDVEGRK
jgi:hypothetical protein